MIHFKVSVGQRIVMRDLEVRRLTDFVARFDIYNWLFLFLRHCIHLLVDVLEHERLMESGVMRTWSWAV